MSVATKSGLEVFRCGVATVSRSVVVCSATAGPTMKCRPVLPLRTSQPTTAWRLALLLVLVLPLLLQAQAKPLRDASKGGRGDAGSDKDPRTDLTPRHEWKRRFRKSSECRLGRERYGLNETWHPNLGPPFGVWGCVQCSCNLVRKKRRMVAKVQCRNIKDQCPEVTCRDPVLLPNACCKMCLDAHHTPMHESPLPALRLGDEPDSDTGGRDFAVLINGRTSQTPMTTARVATGRLSLRKKNLHFSFLLEEGFPPPASIHFLDERGNILEQLESQTTPYKTSSNRLCGTWTRVPRDYRALLREEKMWVALAPSEDYEEDLISGLVSRYKGVDTEVFSALLKPAQGVNQTLSGGGTAIISVDAPTDSLHISLIFNGIFAMGELGEATVVVELLPQRSLQPVIETITIPKVSSDLNQAELRTTLGDTSLRLLTLGQVALKIWSEAAPQLALEGMITPRATCNVYSAVLTPEPESAPAGDFASGWALLTVSNDGKFDYQVFMQGMSVSRLTLETTHRRRHRVVDDLSGQLAASWANGTYTRPTYSDLDALLRGKMEVVAVSGEGQGGLRGVLNPVAVTEALRSHHPVLLANPSLAMAATVWVAVDSACVLHYDVMLAGRHPGNHQEPFWNLTLREQDQVWDPRFNNVVQTLEDEVEGHELSAHSTTLTQLSLSRLEAGVSFLEIDLMQPDVSGPLPTLKGLVQGVHVPPQCLLDLHGDTAGEHGVQRNATCRNFMCLNPSQPDPVIHKCIDHDKKVFEDGSSWPSPANPCVMCMCTKGVIQCLDMVCPHTNCSGAVTPPGECCPVCPASSRGSEWREGAACVLNNVSHSLMSQWHPFLAPKGFDTCTVCTCVMDPRGFPNVNCSRQTASCPPLSCPESETITLPNSCCPSCRKPPSVIATISPARPDMPNDPLVSPEARREEILRQGGCTREKNVYENGAEWNPRVAWIGPYKCVKCKCKDGNITCAPQCLVPECPPKVAVESKPKKSHRKKPGYKKRKSG